MLPIARSYTVAAPACRFIMTIGYCILTDPAPSPLLATPTACSAPPIIYNDSLLLGSMTLPLLLKDADKLVYCFKLLWYAIFNAFDSEELSSIEPSTEAYVGLGFFMICSTTGNVLCFY